MFIPSPSRIEPSQVQCSKLNAAVRFLIDADLRRSAKGQPQNVPAAKTLTGDSS